MSDHQSVADRTPSLENGPTTRADVLAVLAVPMPRRRSKSIGRPAEPCARRQQPVHQHAAGGRAGDNRSEHGDRYAELDRPNTLYARQQRARIAVGRRLEHGAEVVPGSRP